MSSSKRVLLADDYLPFAAAIERLLVQHDYEVVGIVEDGARLLEQAARLQPDIIVLDLHMPNGRGTDGCRDLKRVSPHTVIIVLTADTDADVRQAVLAAGASAFISKQQVASDLLPAIKLACLDQPK